VQTGGSGPKSSWTTAHSRPPRQCTSSARRAKTARRAPASEESAAGCAVAGSQARKRAQCRARSPMLPQTQSRIRPQAREPGSGQEGTMSIPASGTFWVYARHPPSSAAPFIQSGRSRPDRACAAGISGRLPCWEDRPAELRPGGRKKPPAQGHNIATVTQQARVGRERQKPKHRGLPLHCILRRLCWLAVERFSSCYGGKPLPLSGFFLKKKPPYTILETLR
jgi:hypothetical protein